MYINIQPFSRKEKPKMETKKCPLMGGFCWKNPLHIALFLAVIPFAAKGLGLVWNCLHTAFTSATN